MDDFWADAEVISVYTRGQALADGVLVAVESLVPDEPDFARQAGWRLPVAVTAGVAAIVRPTEQEAVGGQSVKGRLWDLLLMGAHFGRVTSGDTSEFPCIFWLSRAEYGRRRQRTLRFKAVVGPGDEGEPVVTIMLPWED